MTSHAGEDVEYGDSHLLPVGMQCGSYSESWELIYLGIQLYQFWAYTTETPAQPWSLLLQS